MSKTSSAQALPLDIGIEPGDRLAVAEGLGRLLADTCTLSMKTRGFHWNVTGPLFSTLHLLFEQQYAELELAADVVAERIRALGHAAPGSHAQFAQLSTLQEAVGVPDAMGMVRQLLAGQETVVRTARRLFPVAEMAGDQTTLDLLTQRLQAHEKNAWMLRSLLE
jgi:starvation-inducible DNA-binding protein